MVIISCFCAHHSVHCEGNFLWSLSRDARSFFTFFLFFFSSLIQNKLEGEKVLELIPKEMERSGRLFWESFAGFIPA